MADIETMPPATMSGDAAAPPSSMARPSTKSLRQPKQHPPPIPIRTFPLPSFYPNNPISLFYVAFAWLRQALHPPALEPAVVHVGYWSPSTRSVNITDPESLRVLWEQGFFGKGTYSRSEPNWLRREEIRRGLVDARVAEMFTAERRQDRADAKWERGRAELQALEQKLLEEGVHAPSTRAAVEYGFNDAKEHNGLAARQHLQDILWHPPVSPLQLLALPNSDADLPNGHMANGTVKHAAGLQSEPQPLLTHGTSLNSSAVRIAEITEALDNHANGIKDTKLQSRNGQANGATKANDRAAPMPLKRQKSVRFSPKVESTTFQHSDPPSPNHSASTTARTSACDDANGQATPQVQSNGSILLGSKQDPTSTSQEETASFSVLETTVPIENKEHLQLSAEEAFFLSFAIGALVVLDSDSKIPYTVQELFDLFRRHSYFPPRSPSGSPACLSPDDPFLVHYVVYHHFRSLGWVVRHGMKFGVDWLLYQGGPAHSHAAFGVIVIPSYTDSWWKDHDCPVSSKPWHWLSSVNRVLTNAYKTLVLVYVDVPSPVTISKESGNIVGILGRYRVREILVKRWTPNRNRE